MPQISRATRGLQWPGQMVPTSKEDGNPKTRSKFGLRAAIRPHEAGIPSNRVSLSRGEYVPAPCTHRPSHHPSEVEARLCSLGSVESGFCKGGEVVTR